MGGLTVTLSTAIGRHLAPYEYASAVLLLEVTWAGRVFRFASERVDAADDDGTWQHAPELAERWERSAALLEDEPPDEIDLGAVTFPVDVALWHARGRDLTDAGAVLSLWVPGRALERRHILARGTVSSARYVADGEPVALTLRPPSLDDRGRLLAPEAVVSDETWSSAASSDAGTPYPIPFGAPGLGSSAPDHLRGATPAPLVDTSGSGKWLVSADRVAASSVTLCQSNGAGTTATQSLTVSHETDGLGRVVAVVEGTGGAVSAVDGQAYWVDWSGSDGGVVQRSGTSAAIGAGDVALWLLDRVTVPWDRGAWKAAARYLNRYRLGFYVDEDRSPLAVLRDEVLPLVPATLTVGPEGVAPVLWRLDATTADAVAHLEEGRNAWLSGAVEVDRERLINEIRIEYAPASDGTPYRVRTVTGRDVGADSADVWPHQGARSSRLRTGRDHAESIDTPNVYDTATADRVLAWMVGAYALPHTRAAYEASPELAHLVPGAVVSLTDSDRHWTDRVALVERVAWDSGALSLSLVLIPSPARDSRPTT